MKFLTVSDIVGLLILSCFPLQTIHAPQKDNGPLKSFADSLRSKGIGTSEHSLVAALKNDDPEVRSLAANQLAQMRDTAAIPEMKKALSGEKKPKTRIEIAAALAALGDPKGLQELSTACSDKSKATEIIIEATQQLQVLHASSKPCENQILERAMTSVDYRAESISLLLPTFPAVSDVPSERLINFLTDMLGDEKQTPEVRIQAGHVLGEIGPPNSKLTIEKAILAEKDQTVRANLMEDIKVIENRQKP